MHSLEMKWSNSREDFNTKHSKPAAASEWMNPESSNPPKKKLKLSGTAVWDKLMVMWDSDVSSLNTELDSQSLISLQE